jgi:hypothetical protein
MADGLGLVIVDPIQLMDDITHTAMSDCLNIRTDESARFRAFVQHLIDEKYLSHSEGQSCNNIGDLMGLWTTR